MSENGQSGPAPGVKPLSVDWYRVIQTRDARFDGVLFVGVTTTGVYCRPVCTARTPGRDRCRYFRSAAEAEREGFRACFRCRPELAPGTSTVDASARLAALAMRRIEEGTSDIDELAGSLGVSARHLRRVLEAELGVSPVELLQTKRAGLARQLLLGTTLPVTDIAFASGFASIRRFNSVVRERFGRTPTELRAKARAASGRARREGLVLRLDYRPPLDWDALIAFLGARAIPGVELAEGGVYRRTVRIGDHTGVLSVRPDPSRAALVCEASLTLAPVVLQVVARVRRLFDLDARPTIIADHLARDPRLAPLVRAAPGLRLPGSFDGFEMAVRAILGQQVTVKGATTLAGRIVARVGAPLDVAGTTAPGLTHVFPRPEDLADGRALSSLGMPQARADAIAALARAVRDDRVSLDPRASVEKTMEALRELPGIGEWTAQYVAMRALGWPDAFPATDLGIRNALGDDALAKAEAWRPWRAYAVMHLWRTHVPSIRKPAKRRRLRHAG
ncbi:MAG: helix-turn-helix domain-containing protein [Deltaproteobacteria bacterium]|nr:helix-turn-helix domain-containing protein [Deltaproteobacteria bacterium]